MQLSNQIKIGAAAGQYRGLTADPYPLSYPWRDVAAHILYEGPQAKGEALGARMGKCMTSKGSGLRLDLADVVEWVRRADFCNTAV